MIWISRRCKVEPIQINPRDDYKIYIVDQFGEVLDEITRVSTLFEGTVKDNIIINPTALESVTIKSHFVKLNERVFVLLEDVNLDKVSRLLPYVSYMSGILCFDNNKRISSDLSISKVCGVGKNNSKKFVNSLINEDIIHKHTDNGTYYTFNPFICLRGDKANIDLFEEFENSKWRYINSGEIDRGSKAKKDE